MMRTSILTLILITLFSSIQAQTNGELSVTTTTTTVGGNYAPRNIVAIWIENDQGEFVKTLMAYAQNRITHLNIWQASTSAAGTQYNTTDAITGATRSSHGTRACSWNALDYNGNMVPDGEYHLWMEITEKNGTGEYSSFAFTKNEISETITPNNVPGFTNININWAPSGVSVQSVNNQADFNIYPNPGNGNMMIDSDQINEIEVRTISGKLILKTKSNSIDLSSEKNGIYLIIAQSKDSKIIKKYVKE